MFVFLLISANIITSNSFYLYLANIVLDNSLFLVGSIFILRDNYYFWQTRCTCCKKSSVVQESEDKHNKGIALKLAIIKSNKTQVIVMKIPWVYCQESLANSWKIIKAKLQRGTTLKSQMILILTNTLVMAMVSRVILKLSVPIMKARIK